MWDVDALSSRVHVAEPGGLKIASYGPVHIVIYGRTPTIEDLRASDRYHRALRDRHPEGTALLACVLRALQMPDSDVRKLGAEMLREVAPQIRCNATVIDGEGFMASAARAVLSGIQLLSRVRCPSKLFSTIPEASNWIAAYYEGLSAEGLGTAAMSLLDSD